MPSPPAVGVVGGNSAGDDVGDDVGDDAGDDAGDDGDGDNGDGADGDGVPEVAGLMIVVVGLVLMVVLMVDVAGTIRAIYLSHISCQTCSTTARSSSSDQYIPVLYLVPTSSP